MLSHTSHPRNIGSVARAMKTMGLSRLYLVNPKKFPHAEATALAAGADDVLEAAVVCSTLDEALADTTLAFAVTARKRDLSPVAFGVRDATPLALEQQAAAFVFGNEMSGLSNEEVMRCQQVVHIPANPAYSSLNVAQAVQVVAYELWMAAAQPRVVPPAAAALATHAELDQFYAHLERSLIASGFLVPSRPKRLMERLRRLFARTRLEQEELNILRGALASFEERAGNS